MGNQTPLFDRHNLLGARIVDFGGWDMPVHYGSQIEEHHAVRQSAGMFDVSHMTIVEVAGTDAKSYLDHLLANDIRRMTLSGQAMYSAMLNESGGILDDLIVYNTTDPYLVIVNCGTREKDLAWMSKVATGFEVTISERTDLAIVAVQGPDALDRVKSHLTEKQISTLETLKVFQGAWCDGWFIARTGYTGERGLELLIPDTDVGTFWDGLLQDGVRPVGLGARDTLRLEAGMNLYGSDMDESFHPFEANMTATVHLEGRDFIGADALRNVSQDHVQLVGLVMLERGVLRSHYPVFAGGTEVGEITSGAFSPTLGHSIALARVSATSNDMTVQIRNKQIPVKHVTTPFVRHGKQVYKEIEQ